MALLNLKVKRGVTAIFSPIRRRLEDVQPIGKLLQETMRRGEGSVSAQFQTSTELTRGGGSRPWPPTRQFGNVPPGPRTLVRTGAYRQGWLGGHGSKQVSFRNGVAIGVDRRVFPQVNVFQGDRIAVARARKRTAKGRLAMQLRLGLIYGVFAKEVRIRPRNVSINPRMLNAMGVKVLAWAARGERR